MSKTYYSLLNKLNTLNCEFLNNIKNCNFFHKIENPYKILYVGISLIMRVFEYANQKLCNIENSYHYAQQASIYYIEYLDQIYSANLSYALDQNDAVLFVYKKTIFELYDNDLDKTLLGKIISNDENKLCPNNSKYFKCLSHSIQVILENHNGDFTLDNMIYICKYCIFNILKNYDHLEEIIEYLKLLKTNFNFSYNEYIELLNSIGNVHYKKKKVDNSSILNYYSCREELSKRYKNNNIEKMIEILIQD